VRVLNVPTHTLLRHRVMTRIQPLFQSINRRMGTCGRADSTGWDCGEGHHVSGTLQVPTSGEPDNGRYFYTENDDKT